MHGAKSGAFTGDRANKPISVLNMGETTTDQRKDLKIFVLKFSNDDICVCSEVVKLSNVLQKKTFQLSMNDETQFIKQVSKFKEDMSCNIYKQFVWI